MVTGRGTTLTDTRGREYLDAMGGLWCVNIGYGNAEMAETMRAQTEKLAYYHTFASMGNEPVARLAQRLVAMAPGAMSKVFFGNSGSDANDTQVKLVWYYNNVLGRPEKKKIISRSRGYHGVTVMSASLCGLAGHAPRLRPAAADGQARPRPAPAVGAGARAQRRASSWRRSPPSSSS